jgi:hypothetical protein
MGSLQAGAICSFGHRQSETHYRKGERFPLVPLATKIAHFFGWAVKGTIAGLMRDLAWPDDTGGWARGSGLGP